jgi:hypothetical protein
MEAKPKQEPSTDHGAVLTHSLGLGWTATIEPQSRGAVLRLAHPEQAPVAVTITITGQGPVIQASAVALELEAATDISARCERFTIDARDSVTIRAPEITHHASGLLRAEGLAVELTAKAGDVRIHANDDVQVKGEQVLLNCERDSELPDWLPKTAPPEVTLPREEIAGDVGLFDEARRK